MPEQQPTNFLQFTLDTLAKEALSFGVGVLFSAGYYTVDSVLNKNNTNRWRNTAVIYTVTSLAATGARVLFSKNES